MTLDNKERDILLRSGVFFMKNGLKAPTMDDVARALRVSKKTLYKYVKDKRDLITRSVEILLEKDREEVLSIVHKEINAIDKVYLINMKVGMKLKNLQPSVWFDLQQYFPEAAACINKQRDVFIYDIIRSIHKQGVEEGLFRPNLNIEILARLNVILIQAMFDPKQFPHEKYSFSQVHREISNYHLRGIVSPKGKEYIDVLVDKIRQKQM